MIVEINEMIDSLEEFFDSNGHYMCVGGVVGTEIEKFVLDVATEKTDFSRILILNGCQDYVGLLKTPLTNYRFWSDAFVSTISEEPPSMYIKDDEWLPKIYKKQISYVNKFDENLCNEYDVIIIDNAHLIPWMYADKIIDSFCGKIVAIVDPIETSLTYNPGFIKRSTLVITDTLVKTSPMIALARSIVGIETRSIDKNAKGTFTTIESMSSRSIGKMDDKQYIASNADLVGEIGRKQVSSVLKKDQKLFVSVVSSISEIVSDDKLCGNSIAYGSMLVVDNPNRKPLMPMKMRLFNSKRKCYVDTMYESEQSLGMCNAYTPKRGTVMVRPANILSVSDATHHHYNNSIFIIDDTTTNVEKYAVLKNSINATFVSGIK